MTQIDVLSCATNTCVSSEFERYNRRLYLYQEFVIDNMKERDIRASFYNACAGVPAVPLKDSDFPSLRLRSVIHTGIASHNYLPNCEDGQRHGVSGFKVLVRLRNCPLAASKAVGKTDEGPRAQEQKAGGKQTSSSLADMTPAALPSPVVTVYNDAHASSHVASHSQHLPVPLSYAAIGSGISVHATLSTDNNCTLGGRRNALHLRQSEDYLRTGVQLWFDELRVCDMCGERLEEQAVGVQISEMLLKVRPSVSINDLIFVTKELLLMRHKSVVTSSFGFVTEIHQSPSPSQCATILLAVSGTMTDAVSRTDESESCGTLLRASFEGATVEYKGCDDTGEQATGPGETAQAEGEVKILWKVDSVCTENRKKTCRIGRYTTIFLWIEVRQLEHELVRKGHSLGASRPRRRCAILPYMASVGKRYARLAQSDRASDSYEHGRKSSGGI
ncbi:hypothetical protein POSPLADRAFT_1048162 [Postia placenta MAD-698-R-SB12]|uniref:Uncharacterized protein n=1 Tax=Postia placenta MAD-698-R-SB12 TaxID=670580 RepID=A0A1X6MTE4_9APHY|nr:hypothetical protein POSPLADRAFT_1048162 [Postia placenta MAD-698-R-SB12]OSX59664.1 hypothetical protein POSPLADRAFT_1048162 [Postia placenta MAD-698-R-SB12]